MNLLNFIMRLGVIYLIVIYGCQIALQMPSLFLLSFMGASKKTVFLVNLPIQILVAYIIVSLTARATLDFISAKSGLSPALYASIGVILIYMSQANNAEARYERMQKQDIHNIDWTIVSYTNRMGSQLILGSLIFYGASILSPQLVTNALIGYIGSFIDMLARYPVVGWIAKGLGIINLVGILMGGLSFSRRLTRKRDAARSLRSRM